jgi:hypothetical protein
MSMTIIPASESGMKQVQIIDQSGQSGDCQVAVTLDDGSRIEVATDDEWRAVHVYDAKGEHVGWVTFEDLFAAASRNASNGDR